MKETIIAIIALAVIMGGIWLGYWIGHEKPIITETKAGITITIPKKVVDNENINNTN